MSAARSARLLTRVDRYEHRADGRVDALRRHTRGEDREDRVLGGIAERCKIDRIHRGRACRAGTLIKNIMKIANKLASN